MVNEGKVLENELVEGMKLSILSLPKYFLKCEAMNLSSTFLENLSILQ